MLAGTVKAEEQGDVATLDVPSVFIQTHSDEKDKKGDQITTKICVAMTDVLLAMDKNCHNCTVWSCKNGKRKMDVSIAPAIHGVSMSGLLFQVARSSGKAQRKLDTRKIFVTQWDHWRQAKHCFMAWCEWHTVKSCWPQSERRFPHFHIWLQEEHGAIKDVTTTGERSMNAWEWS